MKNLLYYKYMKLTNPSKFRDSHLEFCKKLNLKGKVLVSKEGINGCLSGEEKDIKKYVTEMKKLKDIQFKITESPKGHTFKRMLVKLRDEIVTSKFDVDLKKKADYIKPKELKKLLDKKEEVYVIDARNDYEWKTGKFKNAITLDITTFREFEREIKKLSHLKNKLVVTYCTGGVRCEKASAIMKDKGFNKVKQLHGGIIGYGLECGDKHWEGKCFVFDSRGAIAIDKKKQKEIVEQCELCNIPDDSFHDCLKCGKRFLSCSKCIVILEGCCSKKCRNDVRENPALASRKKEECCES